MLFARPIRFGTAVTVGLLSHCACCAYALPAAAAEPPPRIVSCVHLDIEGLHTLGEMARQAGLGLKAAAPEEADRGSLILWEATAKSDITPAQVAELEGYVREGGSLLLTLDRAPGVGPMRLAGLLPTTAWETQIGPGHRGEAEGPIQAAEGGDPAFFGAADARSVHLSFYYRIRPFDAAERGQARYERFARTIPLIDQPVKAGEPFWTRSLLNRDWRVRLRGNDVGRSPLLITGRYGAGRVAVLAGSLADLDASSSGSAVESALLRWLTPPDRVAGNAPPSASTLALAASLPPAVLVDASGRRLQVTLHNPASVPLTVEALARVETWEPALIGDVSQSVTLPAQGDATVTLPLPSVGPTAYQASAERDVYFVRLGVLSASGARLLGETRLTADLRPPVSLAVATDDLRTLPAAFPDAPPPSLQASRMGLPVTAYAYRPGQTAQATVTVANGARNLAPLAAARDETTPDNPSVGALNDLAAVAGKDPIDHIQAYGMWQGVAGKENVLRFTFAYPVTLSAVTLIGSPPTDDRSAPHNPGAVVVEAGGNAIARADDLDARFAAGHGEVTLSFPPTTTAELRIRLPWVAARSAEDNKPRLLPWLGEVEIVGADPAPLAPAHGTVTLALRDALSGSETVIGQREVTVAPATAETVVFPVPLPASTSPNAYRLEARFLNARAEAPVLALQPEHILEPMAAVHPPDAAYVNFIVTRGFRNASDIGTGTQETHGAWEEPDDLVWAYSRRLKQTGQNARTLAGRLYVTDTDFRHYSTPWDTYLSGESFYAVSTPHFVAQVEKTPHGRAAKTVVFGQGDRWDTGPSVSSLYNWQDFVEFDAYLRSHGQAGLQAKTREALSAEIDRRYPGQWQSWQLQRYVQNVEMVRKGFAAANKRLLISAQGIPLVPISQQNDLAQTIRGMSDDSTWGMSQESIPLTTGREMSILAFNPVWGLSTLLQWGWNSAILNFPFHTPVGTTEPTRRHYYDRAWRGIIDMDGGYRSMHTYGYNRNGGEAYTMTANDWQQWWNLQERHSLIAPDEPLGMGLVLSSSPLEDPTQTAFSGGGMGGSPVEDRVMGIATVLRRLHEAGVSVPFSANAATLSRWHGNAPLLLLNLSEFSPSETESLKALAARGVRLAAFAGAGTLSPEAAALFGVDRNAKAVTAHPVGFHRERPLLATERTLLIPGSSADFTASEATNLAPLLREKLSLPITYPEGTAGYGFRMQGLACVEIEDWKEEGRTVSVRMQANSDARTAQACEINDHRTLPIRRDGPDWVIDLPLRPGDGDLIFVREIK